MERRARKIKRLILWLTIGVAMVALMILMFLIYSGKKPEPQQGATGSAVKKETSKDSVIKIAMMGDMLAHDSVNTQAKTSSGYDYTPYFTNIKPLYSSADVVFCNPEIPVAGDMYGVTGYPTFNAPSAFARDLVRGAGCNVINLASNHQADRGQAGVDASLDVWRGLKPFAYSGMNSNQEEQNKVSYFTVKGVKIAFVAFADFSNALIPNSYSLNLFHDTALVERLMSEAKMNAQVVLVSAHWGVEDSNIVSASQIATAQMFVDNGASMIIGTGPHVEQAVSWLTSSDGRRVPVWYSIGNMLSSQLGINGLTSGIAHAEISIKNEKNPSITKLAFDPTFMSYRWSEADKASLNLPARKDLLLLPLDKAGSRIEEMFGSQYSVNERRAYLERVLDSKASQVTVR